MSKALDPNPLALVAGTSTVTAALGGSDDIPIEAEYRHASDPAFSCGSCVSYDSGTGGCAMWDALVDPDMTCDFFEALKAKNEREEHDEAALVAAGGLKLGDRTEAWDGAAAEASYDLPADANCWMWHDPDGDAASKSSYKLPFVSKDGGEHAVWGAITAIAGVLSGGRGGASIPAADVGALKTKVEGYYAQARSAYDDDGIQAPWEAGADSATETSEAFGFELAGAEWDEAAVAASALARADVCPCQYEDAAEGRAAFIKAYDRWLIDLLDGEPSEERLALYRMRLAMLDPEFGGRPKPGTPPDKRLKENKMAVVTTSGESLSLEEAAIRFGFTFTPETVEAFAPATERAPVQDPDRVEDTLPDPHQPGARHPARHPAPRQPSPPANPARMSGPLKWEAVFAPEGKLTDDGRAFAPGAISWRELPLTLMGMTVTSEGGHVGAEVCGRIDRVWRDDAAGLIRAEGVFDEGEYGTEIARMVGDGVLRGVSVDLAIHAAEQGPRSDWFAEDGSWAPKEAPADVEPPSLVDILLGRESSADDPIVFVVTEAVIGMTTVCPFPAFADATIALQNELVSGGSPAVVRVTADGGWRLSVAAPLAASAEEPEGNAGVTDEPYNVSNQLAPDAVGYGEGWEVTLGSHGGDEVLFRGTYEACEGFIAEQRKGLTAAAAGLAPEAAPADWFADPEFDELTALTVTDDGRVLGHAWAWDTCHTAFPGSCRTAPHSRTNYAYYHLGEYVAEDGTRVAVGKITLDTGHAGQGLGRVGATAHYDDTGTVVAYVRVGEDAHGGWVAGSLSPETSPQAATKLRGAVLSGDWRGVDGHLELVALLAVNVPGFPVPRARAELVAAAEDSDVDLTVESLVAAGVVLPLDDLDPADVLRFEELRALTDDRFAELAARAA